MGRCAVMTDKQGPSCTRRSPPRSNGTVWCWSHCRAGRLHRGNTQVVVRIWIRCRSDGGGTHFSGWAGGESWPGKVPVKVRQPAGHRGDRNSGASVSTGLTSSAAPSSSSCFRRAMAAPVRTCAHVLGMYRSPASLAGQRPCWPRSVAAPPTGFEPALTAPEADNLIARICTVYLVVLSRCRRMWPRSGQGPRSARRPYSMRGDRWSNN